ncbi:MAG TPA: NAD(P)/FAD-dependent oxidoreductase [Actinomycetota bacterium]|nr:NAD(P)/FAD-dependent oxidoreductase [Actinomycetota bacterium]
MSSVGTVGDTLSGRTRIVVVGAGFAGFHCLRRLEKLLPPEAAEIVVVSATDYMPYLPLLPEVGAGIVDPRHIAVSLSASLGRTRLVPGHAVGVDFAARTCEVEDPEGRRRAIGWDRLVLAPGSVTRTLPVPGIAEHAVGFKNIAEALYLRDHLLAQLELADATDDLAERRARCTFVVVGGGYTGTEVAAQGQLFTRAARPHYPHIGPDDLRWILVDLAPAILSELGERLGRPALSTLRRRGLDVRLRTTVEEATGNSVRLSDGTTVPTHTLVWCVGVTPGPLTSALGLKTVKGRIVVDEYLTVPGHREVLAAGDAAAVPDLARPGGLTPMTAQHAQRQGKAAARNLAASLGYGTRHAYRHRDLGFVVDLGGWQAVANPLHVPLSGVPAKVVTRAYHLLALPANRLRVATDWFNDVVEHRQFVQLGLVREPQARLAAAEPQDVYYRSDGRPLGDGSHVDTVPADAPPRSPSGTP